MVSRSQEAGMRRSRLWAGALLAALVPALLALGSGSGATAAPRTAASTGDIVVNGDFEQPTLSGWSSSSVDLVPTSWQAASGSWSIDLNAASPGWISQTLPTVAGTTYTLAF